MTRRIVHIDLTCFFVSVERVLDPSLEGKPIMVAGSPESRGVVTCASYEVRPYGVRAGMPTGAALRKCPHAIPVAAHYAVYEEYSEKVRSFLKNYAPVFEAAGLDEFYADWTGCERLFGGDLYRFALRIQKTIRRQFGLPCSLGIASNKVTAKVACDQAKPEGIIDVPPGKESDFLGRLNVGVLCGVGEVTRKAFQLRGLRTCGQLAMTDPDYVGRTFGKHGLRLQHYARGHGDEFLTTEREQKQISREETFGTDTREYRFLSSLLHDMVLDVSRELRDLDLRAGCIRVKLRYSDWVEYSRQMTVEPSHDPAFLTQRALELFKKADARRVTLRLIGVAVTRLVPDSFTIDLLRQDEEKREWLLKTVDRLNYKFGTNKVKVGFMS
jgi:DNA polymerase-4